MAEQPTADDMMLVHQVRGLTVELDRFASEFAAANHLHATDLRALIALLDAARAGIGATPGWLAEQVGLGSAAVTALVDRLERSGHVRRVADTRDRRRVYLVVSDQAVQMGWSFWGPLIGDVVERMRSFDQAELQTVRRFLVEMTSAVRGAQNAGTGERGRSRRPSARSAPSGDALDDDEPGLARPFSP